jgi:uncharacterized protein (TIGR02466 family)
MIKASLTSLFHTEVYHRTIFRSQKEKKNAASYLENLVLECQQIRDHDQKGQDWSKQNYPGGYTCYSSIPRVDLLSSSFEELRRRLDEHVYHYAKLLQYDVRKADLRINSMWINIMPPLVTHSGHIHPQSVVSGTFYLQVPPKASSLQFEDPRLGFFMNSPAQVRKPEVFRRRFHRIQPAPGDVILFESWVRHEVPPNQAQKERISVSFNYSCDS